MPVRDGVAGLGDPRYRVFEARRFVADLERLDPPLRAALHRKLETYVYPQLRQEPHVGPNVKKLRGWEPETWRYRIGPWRFFYEIDEADRAVLLVAVDHRGEAYR